MIGKRFDLFFGRNLLYFISMKRKTSKRQSALIVGAKYAGRYVVFGSAKSNKVSASGASPAKLIKKARNKGIAVPAIVFVPRKNVICTY